MHQFAMQMTNTVAMNIPVPAIPIIVETWRKNSRFPHADLTKLYRCWLLHNDSDRNTGTTLLQSETSWYHETKYLFNTSAASWKRPRALCVDGGTASSKLQFSKHFNNSHYFMSKKKNPRGVRRYLAQDLKCASALYIFSYFVPLGSFA